MACWLFKEEPDHYRFGDLEWDPKAVGVEVHAVRRLRRGRGGRLEGAPWHLEADDLEFVRPIGLEEVRQCRDATPMPTLP